MSLLRYTPDLFGDLKSIDLPFTPDVIISLKAGDLVGLNGYLYTGRDQTHRRFEALLDEGKALPVDLKGQLLYYVGPSPAQPGQVIGAAGPTTSYRMDKYTPRLMDLGLIATMGKGMRSIPVREAITKHKGLYLAAFGGAGAYLSKCIVEAEVVAFEDAGPEALFRFKVENFPAVVINDAHGNDYYEMVKKKQN
ncbi:MAG: FumA C-terminus/TtdB family hydratase beta subunit [Desulfobulbaceae bacterium]|jgi:fumarate hydratase subunit beta|nr:FumA C-terminus/TtdB family hydratase beta subunit [Desulfobulbaceae bacterium]